MNKEFEKVKHKILKDVTDAEQYLEEYFYDKWDYIENLYKGIRRKRSGTSNLFIGLSFGVVETEKATLIRGVFSKEDFFKIKARQKDDRKTQEELRASANSMEALMSVQMADMNLYKAFHDEVLDMLKYSFCCGKLTWEYKEKKIRYYDTKEGKVKTLEKKKVINRPKYVRVSPYDLLIDPDATSVEDARFICHKMYAKPEELFNNKQYNITDEMKRLKKDYDALEPAERPKRIELYEFWHEWEDEETGEVYPYVTTVTHDFTKDVKKVDMIEQEMRSYGAGNYVIRHHINPFKHGNKPFYIMSRYPSSNSLYGLSTLEVFCDMQEFINQMVNNAADNSLLSMQRAFMIKASSDIKTKDFKISAGKLIKVKDFDDIRPLELGDMKSDYERHINMADAFTNRIIGNLDQIDTNTGKSATEARIIAQRANARNQAWEDYAREVKLKKLVRDWIELNQQHVTEEQAIERIGEEQTKKLKIEDSDVDFNVIYDFVLTGETGMIDKITAIESMGGAVELVAGIIQLPPEVFDIQSMVKYTLSKFDLPSTFMALPEEGEEAAVEDEAKKAIEQDLIDYAERVGKTPEKIIASLVATTGLKEEEVVVGMIEAGGIENYIQQIQGGQNA